MFAILARSPVDIFFERLDHLLGSPDALSNWKKNYEKSANTF